MESVGNNKRIAKNTILLYARTLLIMCIQLYTSRVILAELGVVDYGLYGVIGGVVLIFTYLNGSLGSSSSRFITVEMGKRDMQRLKKVFSTSLAMHITMAFIILVLCEIIGLWFLNTKMVIPADRMVAAQWVFQLSVFTAMISITQVPYNATIIAHEHMGVYAYVGMFEAIGKLGVAFLISVNPFDRLVWYAILLVIIQFIVMMTYRAYCLRHFEESKFQFQKDGKLYKSMLTYSLYDTIGSCSVMAQGQGINMVLNVFCGPVVNAARAIAFQVQGATSSFANNFMTAVTPQIIKLYAQGNEGEMMKLVKRSSIFCFVLMTMIVLPLSLEINFVLKLWLGEYPAYTATFTILVLVNTVIDTFRRPRINCFHATGNIRLSNIITGTILCMALPLAYIFMRLGFNPNSVFWGVILTSCISDCTNLLILRRYINYSIRGFIKHVHLRCFAHLVCTSLLPIAVYYMMDDGVIRFLIIGFLSVILSCLSGVYIAFEKEDREKIFAIIKQRITKK